MATINWNEPTLTTNYSLVLARIDEKIELCATLFNNGDTVTNGPPTGSIKLADNSTNKVFQTWSGSSWGNITNNFEMTVTKLAETTAPGAAARTGGYYLDLTNSTGILPAGRFNDTAHGSRIGGNLHAVATTSTNGFMSATDKTKLDNLASPTGSSIATLYHSYVDFPTSPEILAGTEIGTRRYSPSLIFSSITAKMQKANSLIYTSMYNLGTVSGLTNIDATNGNYQKLTLGGATTLLFSTTGVYTIFIHVYQDATGYRSLSLPSGLWENGNVALVTSTANSLSILTVRYDGTNYIYSMMRDIK
jgi:hypothetical protein